MKDLDIHEGDYVETKDGRYGYITEITNSAIIWYCKTDCTDYTYIIFNCLDLNLFKKYNNNFKRIGKYDFTKKDKIEPLPYTQSFIEEIRSNNIIISKYSCEKQTDNKMIIDKINEIIDKVNKIGE